MTACYLSARYGRREEMQRCHYALIQLGYDVASRWYHADADESKLTAADWARIAADDIADIERCDVFVAFTEAQLNGTESWLDVLSVARGGRHVELGYALGRLKRVVIIGPRENAFHHLLLPQVEQFATWEQYAATLSAGVAP
jgi:hypothetical protein